MFNLFRLDFDLKTMYVPLTFYMYMSGIITAGLAAFEIEYIDYRAIYKCNEKKSESIAQQNQ